MDERILVHYGSSYCEVIGCGGHACWMLVYPVDIYCEDYLSHSHWEQLRASKPRRADQYIKISHIVTEGMGIGSRHCSSADKPGSDFMMRFELGLEKPEPKRALISA